MALFQSYIDLRRRDLTTHRVIRVIDDELELSPKSYIFYWASVLLLTKKVLSEPAADLAWAFCLAEPGMNNF